MKFNEKWAGIGRKRKGLRSAIRSVKLFHFVTQAHAHTYILALRIVQCCALWPYPSIWPTNSHSTICIPIYERLIHSTEFTAKDKITPYRPLVTHGFIYSFVWYWEHSDSPHTTHPPLKCFRMCIIVLIFMDSAILRMAAWVVFPSSIHIPNTFQRHCETSLPPCRAAAVSLCYRIYLIL